MKDEPQYKLPSNRATILKFVKQYFGERTLDYYTSKAADYLEANLQKRDIFPICSAHKFYEYPIEYMVKLQEHLTKCYNREETESDSQIAANSKNYQSYFNVPKSPTSKPDQEKYVKQTRRLTQNGKYNNC